MLLACAKLLAAARTCIQDICCSPALTFVVLQCCDNVSIIWCVLNAQLSVSLADSAIEWSILVCGVCRIPLPRGKRSPDQKPAYVDWLYLDDDLRITRGSQGSLFIHTKN